MAFDDPELISSSGGLSVAVNKRSVTLPINDAEWWFINGKAKVKFLLKKRLVFFTCLIIVVLLRDMLCDIQLS